VTVDRTRWLRWALPTALTLTNLGCGLAAGWLAVSWWLAGEVPGGGVLFAPLGLMALALLADGLDGPAARRLGVASALGRRLDQVADAVTSGLMPALVLAGVARHHGAGEGYVVAVVFAVAGVARLATRSDRVGRLRTRFVGLPLPVAGAVLLGVLVGMMGLVGERGAAEVSGEALWGVWALGLGLSGLMLSSVRYASPALVSRWARVRGRRWAGVLPLGMLMGFVVGVGPAASGVWVGVFAWYAVQPLRRGVRRRLPGWMRRELRPARTPD